MIPKSILKPFVPIPVNTDHLEFHRKYTYGDIIPEDEAGAVIDKNSSEIDLRVSVLVRKKDFYVLGFMALHERFGRGGVQYSEEHFNKDRCELFPYADIYPLAKANERDDDKILSIFEDHFPKVTNELGGGNDDVPGRGDKKNVHWNLSRNEVLPIPCRIIPHQEYAYSQHPTYGDNEDDPYYILGDDTIEDLDEDETYYIFGDDTIEELDEDETYYNAVEDPLSPPQSPKALEDISLLSDPDLHDRYIQLAVTYVYEIKNAAFPDVEMATLYETAVEQCVSEFEKRKLHYISLIDTKKGTL